MVMHAVQGCRLNNKPVDFSRAILTDLGSELDASAFDLQTCEPVDFVGGTSRQASVEPRKPRLRVVQSR
jgi:hypothetical protein